MLAETVRNNLKSIQNLEMRTKTRKFSNLFQSDPTITIEEAPIEEILAKANIGKFLKSENKTSDETIDIIEDSVVETEDDITDYIVENPNEVIVTFPIKSNIELTEKLPFFRSLSLKLAQL